MGMRATIYGYPGLFSLESIFNRIIEQDKRRVSLRKNTSFYKESPQGQVLCAIVTGVQIPEMFPLYMGCEEHSSVKSIY